MWEAEGGVYTCQGLSQSNPIGIAPHHAPTIAPTTGYKSARSVSVRGLPQRQLVQGGKGGVDLLELSEYSNPHKPQYDVSVSVLEHGDGG
jgi:hypothetical protein